MNFKITFGAVLLALVIAILVPLAPKQRFADQRVSASIESVDRLNQSQLTEGEKSNKDQLKNLLLVYTNRTVLLWSLYWARTSCGIYQVANYAQTLWAPMQHDGQFIGNGFVECSNALLCKKIHLTIEFYQS